MVGFISLVLSGCVGLGSKPKVPPDAGVWRSPSQGEQWESRQRLVTRGGVLSLSNVGVEDLFSDPQDARAMYLTVVGGGLVYTYDAGETWQQVAEVGNTAVSDVAIDPRHTCTAYLGVSNRALKTVDCNRNYREIYLDPRPNAVSAIAVDGVNSEVIYLGTSGGDLLRSVNGGGSWSRVYQFASGVQWLRFDPYVPSRAYALTSSNGLFRSVDGALSWQSLANGLKPYSKGQEIRSLQFVKDQENTLFLLNRYGLLRSNDGGDTWHPLPLITPPLSAKILAFAVNPVNSKEVFYATASTFYLSADGGVNWVTKRLPGRAAVPAVMAIHPLQPGTLYLGLSLPPKK
ncbi:MAG: hypothetical protein G01um101431_121 [Parcubacteria group bacterium Gr01-1014_31]|nr:MAG: hypothetical protein G01um101431_121 [Parcubacteria group bacterium Gr01-1014_31]